VVSAAAFGLSRVCRAGGGGGGAPESYVYGGGGYVGDDDDDDGDDDDYGDTTVIMIIWVHGHRRVTTANGPPDTVVLRWICASDAPYYWIRVIAASGKIRRRR